MPQRKKPADRGKCWAGTRLFGARDTGAAKSAQKIFVAVQACPKKARKPVQR
jgi:hypothetical protein